MQVGEKQITFLWDLIHDYDNEHFPDEINRCLQTALEAKNVKSLVMPQFTSF